MFLLFLLPAALLAWFITEKLRCYSVKATLIKSLVSVGFLLLAAVGAWHAAAAGVVSGFGIFILGGLSFGLLGDIWLDLKYVYPGDDAVYTYAGFTVFGIGHILYIAGLLTRFYRAGMAVWVIVPIALAVCAGLLNGALEKPMKLHYGRLKPVVLAYGAILFMTVFLSGSFAMVYGFKVTTLNLMFAGGVLFALSDLILSGTYFGEGHERPADIISNYVLYYAGQYLIALSVYYLK